MIYKSLYQSSLNVYFMPVEPNPSAPLLVSVKVSTSSILGYVTFSQIN